MKISPIVQYWIINLFFKRLAKPAAKITYILSLFFLRIGADHIGIGLLLKSLRTVPSATATLVLKSHLHLLLTTRPQFSNRKVSLEEASKRSIILSLPCIAEGSIKKGVLLISFTTTLPFYLEHRQFATLDKFFVFVLEPSWAGYADPLILAFLLKATHCVVQASEESDRVLINTLFPDVRAITIGASDWVNPAVFRPMDTEKKYDSIYVANLNPIKRVFRFLEAIDRIRKDFPDYKACLICAGWGGTSSAISEYISKRKLQNNIEFIPGLPRNELVKAVDASKTNILLSFKEGSNRSLFESMFANVPVICIHENVGVNKSYINEYTGLLVSDSALEIALVGMHGGWSQFEPRSWALSNIAPEPTTRKYGSFCNLQLWVKSNDPEVIYLDSPIDSAIISAYLLENLSSASNEDELLSCFNHLADIMNEPLKTPRVLQPTT